MPGGERWIIIPLPIEHRASYGLGELSYGYISGNERYNVFELSMEVAAQVSQLMPIDILEGGGKHAIIPTSVKPLWEAYIMNEGWTGLPIAKDNDYLKYYPEWQKSYANTDPNLVDFTRWLNETTSSKDKRGKYEKGVIDLNPAKIEYVLNGYLGGVFKFPKQIYNTGESIIKWEKPEIRDIPLVNRVVKKGDERTSNRKLLNEYYRYYQEADETKFKLDNYSKDLNRGIFEEAEKVNFLWNSPEMLRYEIFGEYEPTLKELRGNLKEEKDEEKRKEMEEYYYTVMRMLIDKLHEAEEGKIKTADKVFETSE